ncbi:TPA: hypothetical protein N0F65_004531 [Lagenidium giganteum]|uniref:Uncharacterized protein n=1 Tax=Lagenidium giganteum TaxID=4803 RepID=A0AAV2YUR3_9STRA|nr:TPA: hypothetical protein N0F65_004531 [Lagenidium giganteum]
MMLLQNHRIAHVHAPSRKRKLAPAAPASTAALVTHHDSHSHHHNACAAPKRVRQWNEIEYEEMLLEATLLREELELLVAVALDLCKDLGIDVRNVLRFAAELRQVEALLMQPEGMTVDRIRMACQQMLSMCQYLCQHHNDHFLLIEMHDELRVSRNRCMRFVCQYGAKLGLYC